MDRNYYTCYGNLQELQNTFLIHIFVVNINKQSADKGTKNEILSNISFFAKFGKIIPSPFTLSSIKENPQHFTLFTMNISKKCFNPLRNKYLQL